MFNTSLITFGASMLNTNAIMTAIWETVYMVVVSTVIAYIVGLPLGLILVVTEKGNIMENRPLNKVLGIIINAARSIPFIIMLILVIPLTRLIVGTFIGTTASIVPLTIAAIPFVARLIETSIKEIDYGLVEAAISMGAKPSEIICKVLVPEAAPSIILGVAITMINLVGYSAMAGTVGGGGLGTLAYYYGYQRYQYDVLWVTVVLLIIMVQGVQIIGDKMTQWVVKKRRR